QRWLAVRPDARAALQSVHAHARRTDVPPPPCHIAHVAVQLRQSSAEVVPQSSSQAPPGPVPRITLTRSLWSLPDVGRSEECGPASSLTDRLLSATTSR